ncbi:YwqG family protein [Gorillibacterium sp. sgz5001074]|uniref:YwqG family protein n=1 Tax=Gorillibacterium sp. sgz5001074 TaxID=3446695 RepID=UPI003F67797A
MDPNVLARIQASGLQEPVLVRQALESVRLWTEPAEEEDIPAAHSKIGGRPDLPPSAEWPAYEGRPLHFIAQVNLEQLGCEPPELPRKGMLSFFYDALEQPWGFDPADRGRWKVQYFESLTDLVRREEPEELVEQGTFGAARIGRCSVQTTLPDYESFCLRSMDWSPEQRERYLQLAEEVGEYNRTTSVTHQLLGHPGLIQGDMQLECQLASNGLYCGDGSGYRDPRRAELEAGAAAWRLLLQVDSEEEAGMMWGDSGRLYFWIREEDLRERQFDRVWLSLQCC